MFGVKFATGEADVGLTSFLYALSVAFNFFIFLAVVQFESGLDRAGIMILLAMIGSGVLCRWDMKVKKKKRRRF